MRGGTRGPRSEAETTRRANLFAPSSNIIMKDVTLFFGLIFIEKKKEIMNVQQNAQVLRPQPDEFSQLYNLCEH